MTVPKPEQFNRSVATSYAKIRQRLQDLPALYQWAHGAAHDRVVRDSAGKIAQGVANDPTANVVGEVIATPDERISAQAALRRTLELMPKRLAELENRVDSIEEDILAAMDPLDPKEKLQTDEWDHKNPGEPEKERLRDAQRRRIERGEHIA